MIKIIIDKLTPSNNKLLRMHWRKRHQLNQEWRDEIYFWCMNNLKSITPKSEKKKVKIISYRKKLIDPDNFTGGLKPCVDALKYSRLIFDDSPEYLELETEQKIDREHQRTIIEIKEE